ncbi:MAG: hypothetical protein JO210_17930 [Acidobacteriaceae bacterium]|nr:hypothetical protein [Acidobacteriaceae bacterium]
MDTTTDTTQADVDTVAAALIDLQSSIFNPSSQVAQLTALVQSTATLNLYNTIVVPAQSLASTVCGVENDLAYWAGACTPNYVGQTKPNPEPYCTSEKASINTELNESTIQQAYGNMEGYVNDNPTTGFRGMLHLYSLWLGQSKQFFRPADSTAMKNLYNYWDDALTQTANLRIELLHENDAQDGNPAQLTDFMGNPNATPPSIGPSRKTKTRT